MNKKSLTDIGFQNPPLEGREATLRDMILTGDVRSIIKILPDNSVHCIITSPPYYGLRDYGTATWTGGDENCDHIMPRSTNRHRPSDKSSTNKGSDPITW